MISKQNKKKAKKKQVWNLFTANITPRRFNLDTKKRTL